MTVGISNSFITVEDTPFQRTLLARSWFSRAYLEEMQRRIRYAVFEKTQLRIPEQSPRDISQIMYQFYEGYARQLHTNNPRDVSVEMERLTAMVVEHCVRNIVTEMASRQRYIEFSNTMPFIPDPVSDNIRGTTTPDDPRQLFSTPLSRPFG